MPLLPFAKHNLVDVSKFLSNYEQVKKGFEKAFPNAKTIDYKLKGFDIFESSLQ